MVVEVKRPIEHHARAVLQSFLHHALAFALGPKVRVVRVMALGERRGPALEARALYEEIDAA